MLHTETPPAPQQAGKMGAFIRFSTPTREPIFPMCGQAKASENSPEAVDLKCSHVFVCG